MKLVALIIVAVLLISCSEKQNIVCFSENCIEVEVMDTPTLRSQGLMHRESLDGGMLFVFDGEGVYSFWMKNTLIPLDMIWVNDDFRIVHIENAVPCTSDSCASYAPTVDARYVIEVNAGFALENMVEIGDKVTLKLY